MPARRSSARFKVGVVLALSLLPLAAATGAWASDCVRSNPVQDSGTTTGTTEVTINRNPGGSKAFYVSRIWVSDNSGTTTFRAKLFNNVSDSWIQYGKGTAMWTFDPPQLDGSNETLKILPGGSLSTTTAYGWQGFVGEINNYCAAAVAPAPSSTPSPFSVVFPSSQAVTFATPVPVTGSTSSSDPETRNAVIVAGGLGVFLGGIHVTRSLSKGRAASD